MQSKIKIVLWDRGMAQHLRAHAALPEDLGSASSTHIEKLNNVCNSSSRVSDALWPLWTLLHLDGVHIGRQAPPNMHRNKISK